MPVWGAVFWDSGLIHTAQTSCNFPLPYFLFFYSWQCSRVISVSVPRNSSRRTLRTIWMRGLNPGRPSARQTPYLRYYPTQKIQSFEALKLRSVKSHPTSLPLNIPFLAYLSTVIMWYSNQTIK